MLLFSITIAFVFESKIGHSVDTNNLDIVIPSEFEVCTMYVTFNVPSISISFCCYYCVQTFLKSYPDLFYAQSLDRQTQWMLICLETKKIIKNKDVVFMENSGSTSNLLRCVQVGELKALRWWWMNLPNRLCLMRWTI